MSADVRYFAVSFIVRVPADFDREAMEDAVCQVVGCPGVNQDAPEHSDCVLESFGSCCTEDSEDAYRWLLGPDGDESQPDPSAEKQSHPDAIEQSAQDRPA